MDRMPTHSRLRFLFRPKWIGFHLLVVAAIVAMISLGFWQLRRLDRRQAFNALVEARYDAPVEPLASVLSDHVDPADVEWRPVEVTGEYLRDQTVHIVNRSQNGSAGDDIVDPLRLDDGRIVLVNRGFLPQGAALSAAPAGTVELTGRLRRSQERRLGQLSDPEAGRLEEAQRVDIPRLSTQIEGEVLTMYVDMAESNPGDSAALQPVVKPDLSEGPHLSYAIQWFIFTVCAAVGWVLAVRRSLRSRQALEGTR
jgi:cytochrome oxidase assembly protein ShyY1